MKRLYTAPVRATDAALRSRWVRDHVFALRLKGYSFGRIADLLTAAGNGIQVESDIYVPYKTQKYIDKGLAFDKLKGKAIDKAEGFVPSSMPAEPLVELPDWLPPFPKNYRITVHALQEQYDRAMKEAPLIDVRAMQRLDSMRLEEIFRIMHMATEKGDVMAARTAIRALESRAKMNGYFSGDVTINLNDPATMPKSVEVDAIRIEEGDDDRLNGVVDVLAGSGALEIALARRQKRIGEGEDGAVENPTNT